MRSTFLLSVVTWLGLALPTVSKSEVIRAERTSIDAVLNNPTLLSAEGRRIEMIRIRMHDNSKNKPAVFLQGALHGNETLTTEFLHWLTTQVQEKKGSFYKLLTLANLDIIPIGNPDRFGKSRFNSFGVNLNRNFSAFWGISRENFGSMPLSEPETKALNALFTKEQYQIAVDVHGYVNWVVTPSLPANEVIDSQTQKAHQSWQQIVVSQMDKLTPLAQYRQKTGLGLGDGGAFEDWAFWNHGTFAACLEMASPGRYRSEEGKTIDSFKIYESFLFNIAVRGLAARSALDNTNKNYFMVGSDKGKTKKPNFVHH